MITLDSLAGLDRALEPASGVRILYKHSTRCSVCDTAVEAVKDFEAAHPGVAEIHYLDLLAHRDVSDAAAERLGVRHQSPQVIVLRDGKAAVVLSHFAITPEALARAVGL
jgi:bacillithiol system protein YtxJ